MQFGLLSQSIFRRKAFGCFWFHGEQKQPGCTVNSANNQKLNSAVSEATHLLLLLITRPFLIPTFNQLRYFVTLVFISSSLT
jgi:hypothetical protein